MSRWPTIGQKRETFRWLDYAPHEGQARAHATNARVVAVVGAERGGKSRWAASEVLACLPWCRAGVALAAEEYDEAHAEMLYIKEGLERIGGLAGANTPRVGKWQIRTKGGLTIETVSLKSGPQELTGTGDPFDLVLLVEWGLIRYNAFTAALRRTAETRGRVICCGTLKDSVGWQVDVYEELGGANVYHGRRFNFPAWLNLALYPAGRDDEEIKRLEATLPRDEFMRAVAAEVVASAARVFPEFDHTLHVRELAWDRDRPVELSIDVGYHPSHYAVLAFQRVPERVTLPGGSVVQMEVVHLIDEVWEHYLTHQDVYNMVRERPWWRNVHWAMLGHEGSQHQATASPQEAWRAMARAEGHALTVEVYDAGRVRDGLMRVRTFLQDPGTGQPRVFLDVGCTGTAWEFGHYNRPTDRMQRVISDDPKDEHNDAMDALRNYLVRRYGLVEQTPRRATGGRARASMRG